MNVLSNDALRGRLKRFGDKVETLTGGYTNNGGCCVFAAIAADRLRILGVESRGVVVNWSGNDIDKCRPENSHHVRNWKANGVDFNHVLLEVAFPNSHVYLYDSEQLFRRTPDLRLLNWQPICSGYLALDELAALGADSSAWNSMFDRECIPEMNRLADKILLHI